MTPPLDALTVVTPVGVLAVLVDDGVVVGSGFTDLDDVLRRLSPDLAARGVRPRRESGGVAAAVRAWLTGDLRALDTVAVRQPGGPFLQQAWTAMRTIPPGTTWTYAQLAAAAGRPAAVRAAGSACARNLVAPFVPCHRVVRSDGTLGGYFYGSAAKEWLLQHEGARGRTGMTAVTPAH